MKMKKIIRKDYWDEETRILQGSLEITMSI